MKNNLINIILYKTGWVIKIGSFCLYWEKQRYYCSFGLEKITSKSYQRIGGKSWSEWWKSKKT